MMVIRSYVWLPYGVRPFPSCWVLPHIPHHEKETAVLDTLPRTGTRLQTLPGTGGALPAARAAAPVPPDPAAFADDVARYPARAGLGEVPAPLYWGLGQRAGAPVALAG